MYITMHTYLAGVREPGAEIVFVSPVRQIPNPEGADFFQCRWLVIRYRLRAHFLFFFTCIYANNSIPLLQWSTSPLPSLRGEGVLAICLRANEK